jgi:hypothetical protein
MVGGILDGTAAQACFPAGTMYRDFVGAMQVRGI